MARTRKYEGQARTALMLETWLASEIHKNRSTYLKPGQKVVVINRRFSSYSMTTKVVAIWPGRDTSATGVCTIEVVPVVCPHGCNWLRFVDSDLARYETPEDLLRLAPTPGKLATKPAVKPPLQLKPKLQPKPQLKPTAPKADRLSAWASTNEEEVEDADNDI